MLSDYQCPFCAKMDLALSELVEKYDNLKVVHKDFPLDQACNPMVTRPYHQHACEAAKYKICASKQGKFKEFHHNLLENRSKISSEYLKSTAVTLGLDETNLEQCLESPDTRFKLRSDVKVGLDLKISGTPTLLFDNGRKMATGGMSLEEIERLIQIKSGL